MIGWQLHQLDYMQMRPIVTDGFVWFVCRSVMVLSLSPAKMAEPIKMPFGLWSQVGPRNQTGMGIGVHAKGQFWVGNVIFMTNGWLKEEEWEFFCNGIRALEKLRTKCNSVAGIYVEKWQNMMYISCDSLCQSTNFLNAPRICGCSTVSSHQRVSATWDDLVLGTLLQSSMMLVTVSHTGWWLTNCTQNPRQVVQQLQQTWILKPECLTTLSHQTPITALSLYSRSLHQNFSEPAQ